jgi:hypothetical protein
MQPTRDEDAEQLTERLMVTLAGALPDAMRGVYAKALRNQSSR